MSCFESKRSVFTYNYIIFSFSFPLRILWTNLHNFIVHLYIYTFWCAIVSSDGTLYVRDSSHPNSKLILKWKIAKEMGITIEIQMKSPDFKSHPSQWVSGECSRCGSWTRRGWQSHCNKRRYGAVINIKYNVNCQNPYSVRLAVHTIIPKEHFTIHSATTLHADSEININLVT